MIDYFKEFRKNDILMWHEKDENLKEKTEKVIIKMRDRENNFLRSVIVPTVKYPLNKEKFKVFTYNNTSQIIDKKILDIIDTIPYQIGCCYQNTSTVVEKLVAAGYEAKSYCGWLFMGEKLLPIHHCWAVLDDVSVIDLSDDMTVLYMMNGDKFRDKNEEESRILLADFHKFAREQSNSVRLQPVGQATPFLYYVGCECEPQLGRNIYNALINEYPNHECQKNCDKDGLNPTQQVFRERGLM